VPSPSTERFDKSEELTAHQQYPTIQETLFVDSRKHYVDHHHRIGVSKWEHSIYTQGEEIIELSSIDVSLTVKDIYLKVYLELED
jgi:Uma2 family endonuclease